MSALVFNPDELGHDPRAGLDLACALGVDNVEIRTAWGRNTLLLPDTDLASLRQEIDKRGLSVAALASPLWKWCLPQARPGRVDSFGFPAQVAREDRRGWVERALTVARRLGAPRVRVFSHLRGGPEHLAEQFVGDPLMEFALDAAEEAGIRLLLENEPICTTATVPAVRAALEHYAPRLGLWWDVANACELGEDVVAATTELAGYIDYVHIKDFTTSSGERVFCTAGAGVVPYEQVLPALAELAPTAPWALETHVRHRPERALRDGAAFLNAQVRP